MTKLLNLAHEKLVSILNMHRTVPTVGLTQWNLSTVVLNSNLMISDFPHNIRIRLALLIFLLRPDVALSLPCWLLQLNWDSQQGRDRETSGHKIFFLIGPILFLYIMRKVWYHQILIQNYLDFIVLILVYMYFFLQFSDVELLINLCPFLKLRWL